MLRVSLFASPTSARFWVRHPRPRGSRGGAIADVAELWGLEQALQALRPGFPDTRYDMPAGRMMSPE